MKKILACTDGSAYSQSVYALTAWVARKTGAAVHVLHMLDAHRERAQIYDWSGTIGIGTSDALLRELVIVEETQSRLARERGERILADAERQLKEAGVEAVSAEQQHGTLVDAVTELETNADLVVIGKRGQSAEFAKGHLGSNLERVVRASTRPVLVAAREFQPIERFVLAYDGGPSARKAVDFIADNPLLKGAEGVLVRAGKIDAEAEASLREAEIKLRAAGLTVTARATGGDAEPIIADAVESEKAQLLVMGAYGHSRIRQFIIGSTTTALLRTCKVPVLMFR